jgi:short-subunit dehydrogenase
MEEETMMSAEDCAQHLLKAISSKKRNLILTATGKRTNLVNKFFRDGPIISFTNSILRTENW